MLIRAVLKATGQKILPDKFVIDFANEATAMHPDNVEVVIACSDLYLANGLISHAKTLLEIGAQHAPRDLRVKERLLKVGKMRRTQELASRSNDPETLDAPTTPLDPPTEPANSKVPPAPILLPRHPRRQATAHGLAPVNRKPTVQGVQSPLASQPANAPEVAAPDTKTETTTPADVEEHPRRSRTLMAGFGAAPPAPEPPAAAPAAPRARPSDPPTSVGPAPEPRQSDEGPITRVDADGPPTRAGADAIRQAIEDEGPATAASTRSPPVSDDGPPTSVGPDGPPTAVKPSSLPPPMRPPQPVLDESDQPTAARPPSVAPPRAPPPSDWDAGGPRPAARRAALRRPPVMRPAPPPLPGQRALMGPALEDGPSENEGPTNVTALPPLGPHGLALESRPPPPAPSSDEGDDDPPTRARELAPMAPPEHDAPTHARNPPPLRRPPGAPPRMAPDPDGDTTTTGLGSSQEAPTLSGALTKPFRRPESIRPWPQETSFPAPGGQFDAQPSVGPVGPGGTLAMHVTSSGGEADRELGTLVLNAAEALAAARVDPRPPHARSSEAPGVSQGQLLSSGAFPSQPAPTFGPPPSMAPAYMPEVAPSFGPPPDRSQPPPAFGVPSMDPPPISFGPPPQPFPQADAAAGAPQPSFAPSAFPDPFGPASLDTSGPSYPVGGHEPSRPVRLYVALGVAVVAVASLVGYATYLVLGDSTASETTPIASRPIGEDLENALLAGGPPDLLKADSILRSKEGDGAPEILLARVRERTLSALDVSGDAAGIDSAVTNAKNAGVPEADLAFAELMGAILKADAARADQIADGNRADRSRDALFNLALAVMAERRGDPAAQELLRTALAVEPRLRPATIRLARWLILHGDALEARKVIDTLPEGDPSRKALDALAATKSWLAERKAATKPPAEPAVITAEIPRSLHAIFSAVKLVSDAEDAAQKRAATGKSNPEAQAQLKRAIDEADSPALALLFGDIALARGDEAMAVAAASRTLTLTPGSREALTMLGRASVSLGKLDQLDAMLEKLPPESTLQLRAFSAYEQGKSDVLTKLAQGLTDQTDPGGAVRVRLTRIRGTAPIPGDAIDRLLQADPVGGDLCAVDALLDAGEMEKARVIVDGWGDGALNPLRAPRVARLLRYEGKSREAVSALGAATQSKPVLVERILLGADSSAEREQTLALIDERLGTDRTFWNAYVLAKNGDGDKAKAMLEAVAPPSFDSPLSSRVAAVLAYGEVQDAGRGEPIARVLLESFPKNPDVRRAAKALGIDEKR